MPTPKGRRRSRFRAATAPLVGLVPIRRSVGGVKLTPITAGGPVLPVTFGEATGMRVRVLIALTPDYRLPYWQWGWTDITEFVRWDPGITVSDGRRDESSTVSTINGSMTLENDGRFSRANPFGPYYGRLSRNTPIWCSVDPGSGWIDQLHGYVNAWPKRWDVTGIDSTAPISVGGILRWLQQTDDIRCPIYRAVQALAPNAHWPLEDAVDATSAGSALASGRRATTVRSASSAASVDSSADAILFGAGGGPDGTTTSLSLSYGCGITGPLAGGTIAAATASTWFNLGSDPDISMVMALQLGGTVSQLQLSVDASSVVLTALYSDGTFGLLPCGSAPEAGVAHHVAVTAENSGADSRYVVYLDGVEVASILDTAATVDLPRALNVGNAVTTGGVTPATADYFLVVSQLGFWSRALTASEVAGLYSATDRHAGDMTHERLARVFAQSLIPFYCVSSRSALLGPQPDGTIVEVARDAEKADGGVLFEYQFGFGYLSAAELQNQPVAYTLDQALGQLAERVEADDDDQGYVRQWTATRTDGSSVTYRDPSYVEGEALPSGSSTYNVATDDQLGDIASVRVHQGILDEDRWPQLAINLRHHPELIPMVAAAPPFGARITVANPFEEVGVGRIDAIIQGSTRKWNSLQWEIAFNTTPAGLYDVAVYDDNVSRYGANATYLAEDLDETETAVDVVAGETWATTASHPTAFPGDVMIGGLRYSCTGITGTAPNYQLTIVRLGTDKSHAAGDPVTVADTGHYGI